MIISIFLNSTIHINSLPGSGGGTLLRGVVVVDDDDGGVALDLIRLDNEFARNNKIFDVPDYCDNIAFVVVHRQKNVIRTKWIIRTNFVKRYSIRLIFSIPDV